MFSRILWIVTILSSLSMLFVGCAEASSKSKDVMTSKYKIIEVEDISVGSVKRYNVRTRVDKVLTTKELESISKSIIDDLKTKKPHNALTILCYLPDSDTGGMYTAGKSEWAPYGKWAKAGAVHTGDYSTHNLKLFPGSATGIDPEKVKVPGLSIEIKKKIFFNIVLLQDRLTENRDDSNKAYKVVAKKFGVKENIVHKIALEGMAQGWPMP